MTRTAYLIGGTYARNDLSGVSADVHAWESFLTSPIGGSWRPDEIVDLSGKRAASIKEVLQSGSQIDYSFVCFSGHGRALVDSDGYSATLLLINDEEEVSEFDLNPGSPRCTMLFDCCRHLSEPFSKESFALDEAECRLQYNTHKIFDRALLGCEKGVAKIYGTELDHGAADEKSFTRMMIKYAMSVVENCADGILRLPDAVRGANELLDKQQTPVYRGGRRLGHFPFAIKPSLGVLEEVS